MKKNEKLTKNEYKAIKIAKKIAQVEKTTFKKAYIHMAMMYRAIHDMGMNRDEVICMQNSRQNNGLNITIQHQGKMVGMYSLSTSCRCNVRCARNAKIKGSICEKCFAMRQLNNYKSMCDPLEQNYNILTTEIIDWDDLPIINALYFRIESFGDVANVTQCINYMHLIQKNPNTFFAWWSKNMDIINEMFETTGYEKPANVNFIQSSLMVNKAVRPMYWFVDKVFTVFDADTIRERGIIINCGARSCLLCHLCYEKNDIVYVNEQIK